MSTTQHLLAGVLAACLMICTTLAVALPDDREQPIHITADKAVRDEKRGVTIYTGNVQMRQGSMELDADNLTIFHEDRDANKIVARGQPAKMRQQPEIDEGLVHAHAQVITYFRREELVHLRTEAELQRDDGTLVTGDSIDYYIARELVKAESDRNSDDKKVVVVIPPSLLEDSDDESAETPAPGPETPQEQLQENQNQPPAALSEPSAAEAADAAEAAPVQEATSGGAAPSE